MSGDGALAGQRWLLGVSGGVAAYKAPALVRRLREAGAEVRVVMTAAAQAFIGPLTLQAVSGHPVHIDLLDADAEAGMGHIELARWADGLIIAPATAHLIARLAHGLADDLLSTTVLATEAPVWLAPAMNQRMWAQTVVQDNCRRLAELGIGLIGPDDGGQACGDVGAGRMSEPEAIVEYLSAMASRDSLAGRRFVLTAGPTQEPLDPVRFLGNRSSGRMGFALAGALARAGADVDLVAGPVQLTTPPGVKRTDVQTAEEMLAAVLARLEGATGFIGVAAVADYRPVDVATHKIKKSDAVLELRLQPNPDILARVASDPRRPELVMGFAAETRDLETAARGKLAAKDLDLIAANRVGEGLAFDQPDNALEVFSADQCWTLPRQSKQLLAERLVDIIVETLDRHSTDARRS
ncbi:bifunctional phosphopantothenoylcysteine decarboxylase/phosphopantothenate--cysteine ligase CoaBC [Wenzhouxiangella marina]|uniref:Coenzyme A biosynthesis bifunctional protein CoaBC n=1 Tax=Wenzhouxiangella marina TaxID=1579979 RepID=A0A0K0XS42_9GAMM|nr:bifunctional phosphopantothenoylcysteine decarboxylase/phosphopantothenate--cysteine ligase CoaBC [Wenzhouxiangella marina]AKS40508.1 Phosphopantothenoylcysteine decarboxylase / Phosphopantothenate-cysteine ligase [Wenzhouxiangella marina]MBB6088170.1 phosphopantothenoylcysteine decarboxylase/phosphopantothenate--cysteine ligase [Wenzhouxiangella marina]